MNTTDYDDRLVEDVALEESVSSVSASGDS